MNSSEKFAFSYIPKNVEELKNLPEANLDNPFKTAALAMVVLLNHENDKDKKCN